MIIIVISIADDLYGKERRSSIDCRCMSGHHDVVKSVENSKKIVMLLLILEFCIYRFLSHGSRRAAKFSCQRIYCITITKCWLAYFWWRYFWISTTDINNNKCNNNKIICILQHFNALYFKTIIFGKVQLFMFV